MESLINEDFLLGNGYARELYHESAEKQPIIDYHCHLVPQQVAENHRFADITEVWLGGDHYKWRALRGGNRALHHAKPALSLDAPRTCESF